MQTYRQGDVFIERVNSNSLPVGAELVPRDKGHVVLAYGEVTGHSHAIAEREAELYAVPDTDARFLRIMDGFRASLRHEEHATIVLDPGLYQVRIQRQYVAPDVERRVVD